MKSVILVLSLISINVFAQTPGKPFALDNGKYATECWYVGLTNVKDGAVRFDGYEKGTSTVINQGATNIEYSQSQSEDTISNSITKTTTADLGNGQFKQLIETTVTFSYDNQTQTNSSKYESTLKVDGNKGQTLTVKKDNGDTKPGVGEAVWRKMDDGRIVIQTYLREKRAYTSVDGQIQESVVSNSFCVYTPSK